MNSFFVWKILEIYTYIRIIPSLSAIPKLDYCFRCFTLYNLYETFFFY